MSVSGNNKSMKLVTAFIWVVFSGYMAFNVIFVVAWLYIGASQGKLGYLLLGSGWGLLAPYLYYWRHPSNKTANGIVATLALVGIVVFLLGLAVNTVARSNNSFKPTPLRGAA